MATTLYTAQAHVAGGRTGRGRTSDGQLDLDLRQPKELGGDGAGVNPEQLFAIGYAACFGATLALVGQRGGIKADDAEIDSSVSLTATDSGRIKLAVELRISLPSVTDEQAAELVTTAHQVCPYSNATRGNIDVTSVVNGTRL
ncbi:Ohr subfamily peroxiredoxin [Actinoplanes campanulatus]|uniref:Ohr subfamily peroxiredoxin n=1 Tax=Actinoplanes campanulatus TaxID=113559 RepID=A0A7W5FJC4_9ACTN|nr:organic hydroperoxide resistance protein [Actinoplanes campanulatus]MBB3100360.1 Ohr subfamily peroxiredoxin [Actinoplanes campanulatus]GGN43679.1 putative organic hydroperoxide resistance protein/OsmC-like protein [Actinoplanes campanulatus]GID40838.1 putative organic hydroperoxide resistance protein/OsmC-like protein [Actinoplanes campanulatus]